MKDTAVDPHPASRPLDYLPVGFFGASMGLTGLSVAWTWATRLFAAPAGIAGTLALIALIATLLLYVAYGVKLVFAPLMVVAEFRHPIAGNLFATPFMSTLLLPILIAPRSLMAARVIWVIGTVAMIWFAWTIVTRWMSDRQQLAHATPAWILPVVGLLDVPLALPSLGLQPMLMLFSLAVAFFFAVPLFTLIFARLVFEAPMPDTLQPSLLILSAPMSVGFSTYVVTTGRIDPFAECLYLLMLFMLGVLLGRLRVLLKGLPFRIAWWAVSFPLAAAAIAALRFAVYDDTLLTRSVAGFLLVLATVAILGLLLRTLMGIARGELRTMSA